MLKNSFLQRKRESFTSCAELLAGPVTSLAWSPNGQLLAASSQDAPGFVIVDVTTGIQTSVQAGEDPDGDTQIPSLPPLVNACFNSTTVLSVLHISL